MEVTSTLDPDWAAALLTLKLAAVTAGLLLAISTPLAHWLSRSSGSRTWGSAAAVRAVVGLPLVLPPTVLGFYLLTFFGPQGLGGGVSRALGLGSLPFTFQGLVVASTLYSLPFAVAPLENAFEGVGKAPLDLAATLGAGPWDRFFTVALPLARSGFLSAALLAFAHTVGEFGVVLMMGGNLPGETRVLSVALYDHVEALESGRAHVVAAALVAFSFTALFALSGFRAPRRAE